MLPRLARAAFWLLLVAVLVMATMPRPVQVQASDKVQHMVTFLVLTLAGRWAYSRAAWWKLGGGLALYGLLIELLQALPLVGRQGDPMDLLADCVGIAAALLLARLVAPRPR